jgi:hypothetical protein
MKLLIPLLLLMAFAGCAPMGQNGAADEPYIRGTITRIDAETILVEEDPSQPAGSNKAMLTLTNDTTFSPVPRRSLRKGDVVSVWVTGPIRESYPVQATATRILVEPR